LISGALFSTNLAAQDAPSGSEDQSPAAVEARRMIGEAAAHEEAGRFGLAYDGYMAVYEHMRTTGLPRAVVALFNAGNALRRVPGREADTRDVLQRFLDESTALNDDPRMRDFRSNALTYIAEIDARSPREEGGDPVVADTSGGISPIGPIVMGAGGALLIVGAILGILSLSDADELRTTCGGDVCPPTEQDRIDDLALTSGLADGFLFGGAAIAAVGLVLTFTLDGGSTETAEPATARWTPAIRY
jgi:hypothetical protein